MSTPIMNICQSFHNSQKWQNSRYYFHYLAQEIHFPSLYLYGQTQIYLIDSMSQDLQGSLSRKLQAKSNLVTFVSVAIPSGTDITLKTYLEVDELQVFLSSLECLHLKYRELVDH